MASLIKQPGTIPSGVYGVQSKKYRTEIVAIGIVSFISEKELNRADAA
jgi:hypothetical protein